MKKYVYLVRHGESESNRAQIALGPVAKLTEQGAKEAEVVAGRIERIGVQALIASPYPRTHSTAQAISDRIGLPVELNELFIEWERQSSRLGKSWRDPEVQQMDSELFNGYAKSDDHVHSDEEPFSKLRTRGLAALELLKNHPAEKICVVSHGIFMRVLFFLAILGEDFTAAQFVQTFKHMWINNTAITVLRYDDERGWTAETWNDSAHLG